MQKKLIITTFFLALLGLIMIYSASSVWALNKMGNKYYYLIRQALFFAIGLCAFYFTSKIDYHFYEKKRFYFLGSAIVLLVLVLIPGLGLVRGGARSWLGIKSFAFQPSEYSKVALIIFCSHFLSANLEEIKKFKILIAYFFIIAFFFFLIMLEPDFGTGFIIVLTLFLLLVIAGIKKRYVIITLLLGVSMLTLLILIAPYRLQRIFAYLDPWTDPLGAGFQGIQSLFAITPNGLFGTGLFKSKQKYFYLPEPQTDFIFAIIMEELGLIGAVFILALFLYFFYLGIKISLNSKDKFGLFLSLGIVITIFVQFFINIGVVIGLLPVTGVTLPFLSYGGSSLLINFMMVGILVNIATYNDNL